MPKKKYAINDHAVTVLRWVKKHILEDPRRFDIALVATKKRGPACGTAACIAGWTLLREKSQADLKRMSEGDVYEMTEPDEGWQAAADRDLRLPHGQTDLLFNFAKWPEQFRAGYRGGSLAVKANIAARRIEHFIKTGE